VANTLEEIARSALDSKQFGWLRRRNIEGGAGLEAEEDRVRDEVSRVGETDITPANADEPDHERERGRQRDRSGGIAPAQGHQPGSHNNCQSGGGADGELSAECQITRRRSQRQGSSTAR